MSIIKEDILKAYEYRYACKKFDAEKQIAEEDFQSILETARLSPSSFGYEPWKFLIIQNKELRQKLLPVAWGAQNSLHGASHFVVLLARKKVDIIYNSAYIGYMNNEIQKLPPEVVQMKERAFQKFQEHDFALLESDRTLFDWACKQTYIALGNMLTTAAMLGIDSCAIEGFDIEAVEQLFVSEGLYDSEHFGVSVMAGFGYRAEVPHLKTRQTMADIVEWIS